MSQNTKKVRRLIASTSSVASLERALMLLLREIEKGEGEFEDLREAQKQLLALIQDTSSIQELREHIKRVQKMEGPRGARGEIGDRGEIGKGTKGETGKAGESIKGETGKTPTERELLQLIRPLIPEPIKGEPGLDADTEAIFDKLEELEKESKKKIKSSGRGWLGGGARSRYKHPKKVTINTTIEAGDLILADATAGNITITLPSPKTTFTWLPTRVKKIDSSANTVTIATTGSETIDDGDTAVLTQQYESIDLSTDLINWYIM